jgi:hypothetical protein
MTYRSSVLGTMHAEIMPEWNFYVAFPPSQYLLLIMSADGTYLCVTIYNYIFRHSIYKYNIIYILVEKVVIYSMKF